MGNENTGSKLGKQGSAELGSLNSTEVSARGERALAYAKEVCRLAPYSLIFENADPSISLPVMQGLPLTKEGHLFNGGKKSAICDKLNGR